MKKNLSPIANSTPLAGTTLTDSDRLVDLLQSFTTKELREASRRYQEGIFRCAMRRLNKDGITDFVRIAFCLKHIKDQDLRTELETHPHWRNN